MIIKAVDHLVMARSSEGRQFGKSRKGWRGRYVCGELSCATDIDVSRHESHLNLIGRDLGSHIDLHERRRSNRAHLAHCWRLLPHPLFPSPSPPKNCKNNQALKGYLYTWVPDFPVRRKPSMLTVTRHISASSGRSLGVRPTPQFGARHGICWPDGEVY